jgi:hypothetical protein
VRGSDSSLKVADLQTVILLTIMVNSNRTPYYSRKGFSCSLSGEFSVSSDVSSLRGRNRFKQVREIEIDAEYE